MSKVLEKTEQKPSATKAGKTLLSLKGSGRSVLIVRKTM
jgi:hypothetical protein